MAFFCLLMIESLYSATGKLSGRVQDAETGAVLAGANVIVEGTHLGAACDMDGRFYIFAPAGVYRVKATMMGYTPMIQTDVRVVVGLTTELDFSLSPMVIEGQAVVVVAEKPVIKTDVASSQTMLDGRAVSQMPVGNFKEVLDKQVGIQEVDMRGIFMRGQRQSAISLLVDGMESRDAMDDLVYTRYNPDELEQVEINAGGLDASYGNASAGVIALVSKEGGERYEGTLDYRESLPGRKHFGPPLKDYWDEYFLGQSDDWWADKARTISRKSVYKDFKNRPELLKELYRWRMRDEATQYGEKPDLVMSATFGGPVPFLPNTTFFSSYRREKAYYLYPGVLDHFFDQNGMGKLTTHVRPNMKLSLKYRYNESRGLNRYDYYLMEASRGDLGAVDPDFQTEKRYQYEGVEQVAWSGYGDWPYVGQMGFSTRYRNQLGLTFTHLLSSRTYYEVHLLADDFRSVGGQGDLRDTTATLTLTDPLDPDYTVTLEGEYALGPVGYWPVILKDPFVMNIGGTYGYAERNRARSYTLRANVTSQVNRLNQVNGGFQYTYYDLDKREDRDQPPFRDDVWRWHVYPRSLSFWVSDKLEFEGMVLDLGLRGDVRMPDEWLDWRHHPWDYHWSDLMPADSNLAGPHYHPPWKLALAPRLKISHPIAAHAKIFFNWGHYYQDQPFERQYMFYRRGGQLLGDGWTMYGDPELPYVKSVQYEIGYEHNVLGVFRLAASVYYKDVKNLLLDRFRMRGNPRPDDPYQPLYYVHSPSRYLSSQGIELRVEKQMGRFWSAWFNLNYELYTRGVYGFGDYNEDPTRLPNPFDYAAENRSRAPETRMNVGASLHTPPRFGPKFLGFHPAADMDLNLLFWWRQQPTLTYNPERLTGPYAPRDNMRWRPHWAVNLHFSKRFDFGIFMVPVLYVEVYNLLNTKNMFRGAFNERPSTLEQYLAAVEEAGGRPGDRGDLAREAIGNIAPAQLLPLTGTAYDLYLNPRQVYFGIRFEIN